MSANKPLSFERLNLDILYLLSEWQIRSFDETYTTLSEEHKFTGGGGGGNKGSLELEFLEPNIQF